VKGQGKALLNPAQLAAVAASAAARSTEFSRPGTEGFRRLVDFYASSPTRHDLGLVSEPISGASRYSFHHEPRGPSSPVVRPTTTASVSVARKLASTARSAPVRAPSLERRVTAAPPPTTIATGAPTTPQTTSARARSVRARAVISMHRTASAHVARVSGSVSPDRTTPRASSALAPVPWPPSRGTRVRFPAMTPIATTRRTTAARASLGRAMPPAATHRTRRVVTPRANASRASRMPTARSFRADAIRVKPAAALFRPGAETGSSTGAKSAMGVRLGRRSLVRATPSATDSM
jgi:hypothetical protein